MTTARTEGWRIAGVCSCVPETRFDNLQDTTAFSEEEVRKVTGMAGVSARHVASDRICSSDLCEAAARQLMEDLAWEPGSVDCLIMVTQTPDYFMPSTSCVLQHRLGLLDTCAAFDVGLGCSGYPYGLWLASMMVQNGTAGRVLLLHGETPSRYADKEDRAVSLLFGDAGSATAIEADDGAGSSFFVLRTEGKGHENLIVEAGGFRDRFSNEVRKHYVQMNGSLVFNFTIKRVPELIEDTLGLAAMSSGDIDYYIFHQANRFIISHLAKKVGVAKGTWPLILEEFGNVGGPSLPLTLTQGDLTRPEDRPLKLLLLGFGTGWSWGSALLDLTPDTLLNHVELPERTEEV